MLATMPRRSTKEIVSVRLNGKLLERLDAYAERIERSRSDLIDRAVEEYLSAHDKEPERQPQKHPTPRR